MLVTTTIGNLVLGKEVDLLKLDKRIKHPKKEKPTEDGKTKVKSEVGEIPLPLMNKI